MPDAPDCGDEHRTPNGASTLEELPFDPTYRNQSVPDSKGATSAVADGTAFDQVIVLEPQGGGEGKPYHQVIAEFKAFPSYAQAKAYIHRPYRDSALASQMSWMIVSKCNCGCNVCSRMDVIAWHTPAIIELATTHYMPSCNTQFASDWQHLHVCHAMGQTPQ